MITKIFTMRVFTLFCIGSVFFMAACNKENTAKGGKYNGQYEGKAYYYSGDEAGDWYMEINNESLMGSFIQDDERYPFHGEINNKGKADILIQMMNGYDINADITVNDENVFGEWKDSHNDNGLISGRKKSGSGSGSGSCSSHELIGKWYTPSGNIDITFNGNCSGTLHYKDVNNTPGCESGSITTFKWSTDNNMLSLDYTSMTICGEKRSTPANDDPKKYSISGGTLTWAGSTWTKK